MSEIYLLSHNTGEFDDFTSTPIACSPNRLTLELYVQKTLKSYATISRIQKSYKQPQSYPVPVPKDFPPCPKSMQGNHKELGYKLDSPDKKTRKSEQERWNKDLKKNYKEIREWSGKFSEFRIEFENQLRKQWEDHIKLSILPEDNTSLEELLEFLNRFPEELDKHDFEIESIEYLP